MRLLFISGALGTMLELWCRNLGGLRTDFARKAETGEVLNPLVFSVSFITISPVSRWYTGRSAASVAVEMPFLPLIPCWTCLFSSPQSQEMLLYASTFLVNVLSPSPILPSAVFLAKLRWGSPVQPRGPPATPTHLLAHKVTEYTYQGSSKQTALQVVFLGLLLHWFKALPVSGLRSNHWLRLLPQEKGCPSRQGEFDLLYELFSPKIGIKCSSPMNRTQPQFWDPSIPRWGKISPSLLPCQRLVKSTLHSFTGKAAQLYSVESYHRITKYQAGRGPQWSSAATFPGKSSV